MPLTFDDTAQIHHIAQIALVGMCVRAFASSEFQNPEVREILVRVSRPDDGEAPVDVEFLGVGSMPIGGMSV